MKNEELDPSPSSGRTRNTTTNPPLEPASCHSAKMLLTDKQDHLSLPSLSVSLSSGVRPSLENVRLPGPNMYNYVTDPSVYYLLPSSLFASSPFLLKEETVQGVRIALERCIESLDWLLCCGIPFPFCSPSPLSPLSSPAAARVNTQMACPGPWNPLSCNRESPCTLIKRGEDEEPITT